MLTQLYFYPRPPGGGRPFKMASFDCKSLFLSTPSGWRATIQAATAATLISLFLSTPSGWRATAQSFRKSIALRLYFYPRPPGGGRLAPSTNKCVNKVYFYPRPPGGGRPDTSRAFLTRYHFYPRPPGGGRQLTRLLEGKQRIFLSTPSGWRATGRGERRGTGDVISIHALRVEGDSKNRQSFHLFLRKREKNLPL